MISSFGVLVTAAAGPVVTDHAARGTRLLAVLRTAAQSDRGPLDLPIAVSSDGSLVATANGDTKVEVWNTRSLRRVSSLVGSTGFVSSLAFDATGELLAAGSFDHGVHTPTTTTR